MKSQQKKAGLLAVVVAVLALGAWWLWGRSPAKAPAEAAATPTATSPAPDVLRFPQGAPQLTMLKTQALNASAVPLTEPLSARLVYDEDATARIGVGLSGRIVTLHAAPGDNVKAGQVLAEIDSPDVGTALADLNKAKADEQRKALALKRAKELAPDQAMAAKDVESAQADYAQAKAETARAQQRLNNFNPRNLKVTGQRIALTSPLNGVVTERNANPAMEVAPGMASPLFVVTDPRRLWVLLDVPERLLGRIPVGATVTVESDAYPDERFAATIVQRGQVVDPNSRRVVARARLNNPAVKLLPEMFVRASVLQNSGSGVAVPNAALVNRGLYTAVFVETAPGTFQRRTVKLLTRGSDVSFVGEGLTGGERIVTTGALLLDAEMNARAGDKADDKASDKAGNKP